MFKVFLIFILVLTACSSPVPEIISPEPINAPSDFQIFMPEKLVFLSGEPDYYNPNLITAKATDSLAIRSVSVHSLLNLDPGYRLERNLDYTYYRNALRYLDEELLYNRKSIHKRRFRYSGNYFLAPVITNQKKKSSDIVQQLFGLGAVAIEYAGLSENRFRIISDSVIQLKKMDPEDRREEWFIQSEQVKDTFPFGTVVSLGTPEDWHKRLINTPGLGWITVHEKKRHPVGYPDEEYFLFYGNRVKRSYLYDNTGRFDRCIDSMMSEGEFIRKQVFDLTYDSLEMPAQLVFFSETQSGLKQMMSKHVFHWK